MDDASEFGEVRSQVLASYQRGDYGSTLRLALRTLDRFPEQRAEATFWVACMRSVMGDPKAAVRVLRDGLADGMWWAPTRLQDSDLDDAREIAEFADRPSSRSDDGPRPASRSSQPFASIRPSESLARC